MLLSTVALKLKLVLTKKAIHTDSYTNPFKRVLTDRNPLNLNVQLVNNSEKVPLLSLLCHDWLFTSWLAIVVAINLNCKKTWIFKFLLCSTGNPTRYKYRKVSVEQWDAAARSQSLNGTCWRRRPPSDTWQQIKPCEKIWKRVKRCDHTVWRCGELAGYVDKVQLIWFFSLDLKTKKTWQFFHFWSIFFH